MNGMEVADNIHKLPLESIPQLLMISAHGLEAYREKGENLHFAGFLVKPVNPVTLWNTILKALGKNPASPRLADMDGTEDGALSQRRGTRVLLVEDNEINQEVASSLMERMGMSVTLAENGLNAVNACKAKTFDIIFMDIQMPVMDGLEAARRLRAQEADDGAEPTPIIAMTAHAMREDREKSRNAGMDDHITKPIDPDMLARILIKWVKPYEQAAHAADHAPACSAPANADAGRIFDWEKGLFYVGGNEQLLVKQLKNFARQYAHLPQTLADLSAAGQWPGSRPGGPQPERRRGHTGHGRPLGARRCA